MFLASEYRKIYDKSYNELEGAAKRTTSPLSPKDLKARQENMRKQKTASKMYKNKFLMDRMQA